MVPLVLTSLFVWGQKWKTAQLVTKKSINPEYEPSLAAWDQNWKRHYWWNWSPSSVQYNKMWFDCEPLSHQLARVDARTAWNPTQTGNQNSRLISSHEYVNMGWSVGVHCLQKKYSECGQCRLVLLDVVVMKPVQMVMLFPWLDYRSSLWGFFHNAFVFHNSR